MHTDPQTVIHVTALPKRQVFGAGKMTIRGGFRASNGARVTWTQTVSVSPTHIQVGGIRISASFPGKRSMLVQVRMAKSYCSQETCPFGATDRHAELHLPEVVHARHHELDHVLPGRHGLRVDARDADHHAPRPAERHACSAAPTYLAIIRAS